MTEIRTKLSPPWITYLSEITALFENDPEVTIEYDNDDYTLKLFVASPDKAEALYFLLPEEVDFGNVILEVIVVPPNGEWGDRAEKIDYDTIFNNAFKNNPVYAFCKTFTGPFSFNATYVVFKNRVVQFYNDNLNDIYGNMSTLYQEIASDVFKDFYGVYYCTDVEELVGKPLGEWP